MGLHAISQRLVNTDLKSAKDYIYGVRHLRNFCILFCPKKTLPLQWFDWAMYISYLLSLKLAPSTVGNYLNHCVYMHETAGYKIVLKDLPFIGRTCKNLRKVAKTVKPIKLPLTTEIVERISGVCRRGHRGDFIFLTILIVGVLGFFRLGELLVTAASTYDDDKLIKVGHFLPRDDHAIIWIPMSKTDPYGTGTPVKIPRIPNSPLCPVARLEHLCHGRPRDDPLFMWDGNPRTGKPRRIVTRDSFLRRLKQCLRKIGINPDLYAGHSLRRGGAVSAERLGIPEQVIKVLGRWTTDCWKRYIQYIPEEVQALNKWLGFSRSFFGRG